MNDTATTSTETTPSTLPTTVPAVPSHALDVQPIWNRRCGVGCHLGLGLQADLSLAGDGYADLVAVNSSQVPGMVRVLPAETAQSYLWHKLEGTFLEVGGEGRQMPKGAVLSQIELDIIEQWIEAGANP